MLRRDICTVLPDHLDLNSKGRLLYLTGLRRRGADRPLVGAARSVTLGLAVEETLNRLLSLLESGNLSCGDILLAAAVTEVTKHTAHLPGA